MTDLEITRRAQVEQILNEVIDPCSATIGVPIGLAEMGIVDVLDVTDSTVRVRLVPTSPMCLFVGLFDEEIRKRLLALDWCSDVTVDLWQGDEIWDERRLSAGARQRLERSRRRGRC